MTSVAQILERAQHRPRLHRGTKGIFCPTEGCHGRMDVIFTRSHKKYVTRRRICIRCQLRVTTCEKIQGGYTAEGLQRAQEQLAKCDPSAVTIVLTLRHSGISFESKLDGELDSCSWRPATGAGVDDLLKMARDVIDEHSGRSSNG